MPVQLRVRYGFDTYSVKGVVTKEGFYWPSSPQKREEIQSVRRGSVDAFESTYQARPGQREGSIFLEADFAYYRFIDALKIEDLIEGIVNKNVQKFVKNSSGIFQSWDTAFSETQNSAWSVCITAMFVACNKYHRNEDILSFGECEPHYDIYILDVYREKLDWGGLVKGFRSQFIKWQPELVLIEKRASGIALFQSMSKAGFTVRGVETTESKRARAVNGVGAGSAQSWFRLHRVLFPEEAPWLSTLKTEMKDFSGADDGVSDQVDAIVHLIRYGIVAGSGGAMLPTGWTPDRGTALEQADVLASMGALQEQKGQSFLLTLIGDLPNMSDDPFEGLCGRCVSYEKDGHCSVMGVKKAAIDSCMYYSGTAKNVYSA